MSKPSVLVPLANGFEEIECISVVDILRRCGIDVVLAGIDGERAYIGAHDIMVVAPVGLGLLSTHDIQACSGIILPGGSVGMQNLCASTLVIKTLQDFAANGKLIAAICASPIVLDSAKVLRGEFACYPSCETSCKNTHALDSVSLDSTATQTATYNPQASVITQGNQITAAGPASAPFFALEIVRYLLGEAVADKVERELLLPMLAAKPTIVRN